MATVRGPTAKNVINVFAKITLKERNKVEEVTLDMAPNMELIVKNSFTNATLVTD